MSRKETRRRLEELGRRTAPPPRAVFAAELEERLGAVAAVSEVSEPLGASGPQRSWLRSPVAWAAAGVLLVALAVSSLGLPQQGDPDLRLTSASDAFVTMPDGTEVAAREGLALSEGDLVRTGPTGHVEVAGVELGPGEAAVVSDGRLRPVPPTALAPDPEPTPRPTRSPALVEPPRPVPDLLPEEDPGAGTPQPRPTTRPDGQSEEAEPDPEQPVDPTQRPSPSPSPAQDTAPEGEADEQPTLTEVAPDERHRIGIAVAPVRDGYVVMWTAFEHEDLHAFVVLHAQRPAVPQWPLDRATTALFRTTDPEHRSFRDSPRQGRPVYRVVAVDGQGRELARSQPLAPTP